MWGGDCRTGRCETRGVLSEPKGCPRCGSRMFARRNRQTGEAFFGCSRFPDCKGTRRSTVARRPASGSAPAPTKVPRSYRSSAQRLRHNGVLIRVVPTVVFLAVLWAAADSGLLATAINAWGQWAASQFHLAPTPAPR